VQFDLVSHAMRMYWGEIAEFLDVISHDKGLWRTMLFDET